MEKDENVHHYRKIQFNLTEKDMNGGPGDKLVHTHAEWTVLMLYTIVIE